MVKKYAEMLIAAWVAVAIASRVDVVGNVVFNKK